MSVYDIGKLIKQLRKQKGMTQDELANGIIDRTGLSRIENGGQLPHISTLNALFQRLGFDAQSINHYVESELFEIYSYRKKLDNLLLLLKTDEAEEVIKELENHPDFQKPLDQQYILSAKAAIAIHNKAGNDEIYRLIIESIKLSIPLFKEENIGGYYITKQEYRIINMLHIYYYNIGDNEKSLNILLKLKKSIDNSSQDVIAKSELYPNLIYNLTKSLIDMERYSEAIGFCDDAINVCIESGKGSFLPLIVMNKAHSLFELGDMKAGRRFILQAYYGCDMFGRSGTTDNIKKFVREKYNIILDDI